mgnify:CR=1 FL=1
MNLSDNSLKKEQDNIDEKQKIPPQIAVFDLETSGFDPQKDSIVQIGIVLLDTQTGKITPLMNTLCREVEKYISQKAWIFQQNILSYDEVMNARDFNEYYNEIQNIATQYVCTAYNIKFDFRFLEARGIVFNKVFKDIMSIASEICRFVSEKTEKNTEYRKYSVEDAYKILFPNRPFLQGHIAIVDATREAEILMKCLSILSAIPLTKTED